MADHDEMEDFEITDQDLMHAGLGLGFRHRKSSKRAKEEAIYGLWAEHDSDDEGGYGGGRRKKDYSRPLSFISGGIVQKGKDKKEDGEEENEENQEEERDTRDPYRSKKLFKGQGLQQTSTTHAGMQTTWQFGQWEKYTKGFGLKMLQKMGYEPGKGLGKDGKGRVQPVEAFKREGRGALGLTKIKNTKTKKKDTQHFKPEELEEQKFQAQLHQWKKTTKGGKSTPKYIYKTADEVKATGGSKKGPSVSLTHSKIKVVDMTGPETKILTGYGSLSQQHAKPDEIPPTTSVQEEGAAFSMPELVYNLGLLVDMAEDEILQTDRQLQFDRDLVVNLKHEQERLDQQLKQEEKQINRLVEVMQIIDRCNTQSLDTSKDPLSLDTCEEVFKLLQEKYYEEYKMYELGSLAIPLVFPLVKQYLLQWRPLIDGKYGLDVISTWKKLLQSDKPSAFTLSQMSKQDTNSMDIYERLIWEVWMPYLRTAVSIWNCRDSDPMIDLLEHWLPVLPPWIFDNIRDQLILPRLQGEVEVWNPLTDPVPIHTWIHPWLPLMGQRLEPLFAPIRFKLSSALTNWHPSDPSAKMILQPWRNVFSKGFMDAFVLRSIFPKLSQCLAEFVINPHQQHLEPFHWVMSWKEIIPLQHFVSLLDKHFFPKWSQVLRSWLSSNPNYDEVTKWYMGWKSMFKDELLNNVTIKAQFNRALDLMNQAVASPGGYLQPGAKEHIAYLTSTERRRDAEVAALAAAAEKQKVETARAQASAQNIPSNFKDLIQKMAEENNIVFTPNRRQDGKMIYNLGKLSIYIERGVVYTLVQGTWSPVSVQELIMMAK
ncbi:predicted protein [Nematostella vectensis]|uniref:G-patch domain-containing protein n=1 Tax=Nematostella vectensis TaxID=45351 RepID=A7RGR3_NEMVE|nr:predicted protein [Nematostella vectensis]|eukprot:XP_001641519.1 predicted protein [Nematostella vectensis]